MVLAAILVLLAFLHVYWAFGGRWPGRDSASLAELVVGTRGEMPSALACHAVAAVLGLAAALVLDASGTLPLGLPSWMVAMGAWGVVAVLALRGLGGFFEGRLRPSVRELPYHRWNVRLYSPLCLALAVLGAITIV